MEKKLSKYVLVVLYLLFVLTGVLFVINDYKISLFMPLSPIIYTICFLVIYLKRRKAFNSIVVVIIYTMFFFRMVIVPVIYVASGYTSVIRTASGVQYLNEAVMLVGFEFICVTPQTRPRRYGRIRRVTLKCFSKSMFSLKTLLDVKLIEALL